MSVAIEEAYGRAWRELARKEGHAPALPRMSVMQSGGRFNGEVLAVVRRAGRCSRRDVSRQTGIPHRQVDRAVIQLAAQGLVKYEIVKGIGYVEAI